jgi:hypothetical protein
MLARRAAVRGTPRRLAERAHRLFTGHRGNPLGGWQSITAVTQG